MSRPSRLFLYMGIWYLGYASANSPRLVDPIFETTWWQDYVVGLILVLTAIGIHHVETRR